MESPANQIVTVLDNPICGELARDSRRTAGDFGQEHVQLLIDAQEHASWSCFRTAG